jgi:hypothetical protein
VRRRLFPPLRAAAAALLVLPPLAAPAGAQQGQAPTSTGTRSVVAGPEYRAGKLKTRLLGASYRDLWGNPVTVPVLDLHAFAGGLAPTKRGGGNQTKSLRFEGGDGREYAFRSVDKDVTGALPRDIRNTLVDRLIQDQTRAQLPAAVVSEQVMERAAGILHAPAQLYVMPDDPALGEFRADFAGMLGTIEERPGSKESDPSFAGAEKVVDTDVFEKALLESADERLDARDYLAVRLYDVFIDDWDRHEDQYGWARFSAPGAGHAWRAVPRDRDYAYVDYDGALMPLGRSFTPKLVRFQKTYPRDLTGLVINAQFLDRRLLGELPLAAWDSVADALRARVTDGAIDSAVAALPPEYRARRGAFLAERLRARRDGLPGMARRFYALLAREPEVHGTDGADYASAVRNGDGSVDLSLSRRAPDGSPQGQPFFHRVFLPRETREVRVFLHGGSDRFVVRGDGGSIRLRVVADSGADRLDALGRGPVTFYTREGHDTITGDASVNRHSWKDPAWIRGDPTAHVPREWGQRVHPFAPWAGWRTGAGFVVGVGPGAERWGFRREPDAWKQSLRALYSPLHGRFGVQYLGSWQMESVRTNVTVDARATQFEVAHFYGFGNETPSSTHDRRVWQHGAVGTARLNLPLARRVFLSVGPQARWLEPQVGTGTPLGVQRPRGAGSFTAAGAGADLSLTPPDSTGLPRRSAVVTLGGSAYPAASGAGVGPYGEAHALARTYLTPPGRWTPTLALRAGGQRVWGDFPFQDAATIGGFGSLRGYRSQRYQGDAAAWGSAELRVPVTRANLWLVKGDLGALALEDAGRVWMGGASPGGWHTAYGGGVWFSFLDRSHTASVVWAHGEKNALYAQMEIPF